MSDYLDEREKGIGLPGWCRKNERGFWAELPNGEMSGPWKYYKSAVYAYNGMENTAYEIDEYGR